MLCSVFTPSHDGRHLSDCYQSLKSQVHPYWEWILLPNGADPPQQPPESIGDDRVRVLRTQPIVPGIGALKRMCCDSARGRLLIELDHDDALAPDCLSKLVEAATKTPDGFYFSDFIQVDDQGNSRPSDADWEAWRQSGWERFPVQWQGKQVWGLRSFDACPKSLASVGTAPNHVRCWSREAYEASGGHDPALPVCDDIDLVQRTYLTRSPFVHVEGALYAYREHANTYRRKQDDIRAFDLRMQGRVPELRAEWCRRHNLPMVDLGSGPNPPKGYFGLDKAGTPDIKADFGRSIPFESGSVGVLRAFDALEHIPQARVVDLWNEMYRVLAPGGWLVVQVPSTDGRGAWCDPTHLSYWNQASWRYATIPAVNRQYLPDIKARFVPWKTWDTDKDGWGIIWSCAELVACKGQRVPGGSPW